MLSQYLIRQLPQETGRHWICHIPGMARTDRTVEAIIIVEPATMQKTFLRQRLLRARKFILSLKQQTHPQSYS